MDLENNIKKIESLISEDRIPLAIKAVQELLERDSEGFFSAESTNLVSIEARYTRNERVYKQEGTLTREDYDLELNKIKQGIFSIRDRIIYNPEKLGLVPATENSSSTSNPLLTVPADESLVDKVSKIVVVFLMVAGAVLLIYFIGFSDDEGTQTTGILASGGVMVVSLFKQTLDKYINLRFS